jgi:predicted MFS family arabinose efflux permease
LSIADSNVDRGAGTADAPASPARAKLPLVVYVLALGTFLMLTTEFVVAGLLPEIAADLMVSVAQAGLLITVFAIGMVVGSPLMAMLTLRLPHRLTLVLALLVFAVGHVIVAIGSTFFILLLARFLTALATGAFWSVAAVVATGAVAQKMRSNAVGVISAGGMLATVLGVPLGAMVGQLVGWRGTFWILAGAALAAVPVIARNVPQSGSHHQATSIRSELAALRSGRLWLALSACALTTGGVLAAYSYISPLLLDHTGVSAGQIPLVLAAFGVGAFVGSIAGGRLGDRHPHAVTMVVPAVTTAILLALFLLSDQVLPTVVLVSLLGLFGLSANPALIVFSVRFAGAAPTLGSALSVSAFNVGTAFGTWVAGFTLTSSLGVTGPVALGAAIMALTIVPAAVLATKRRRVQPTELAASAHVVYSS